MTLRSRVALVTGGASGIGTAVCRALDAAGASVAVVDRDLTGAAKVSAELRDSIALGCDVADSAAVDDAFAAAVSHFGGVDAVAHIAGVDDPETKSAIRSSVLAGEPVLTTPGLTDDQWRRILSINLDGSFFVARAALRHMTERRAGSIVLMSSVAGIRGVAGLAHYSAAKAGVIGLTRSLAQEAAEFGVRVNAVAPGNVDTPMARRGMPSTVGADVGADASAAVPVSPVSAPSPLGRVATADDMADIVVFLLSDAARYVTGETINASGGSYIG